MRHTVASTNLGASALTLIYQVRLLAAPDHTLAHELRSFRSLKHFRSRILGRRLRAITIIFDSWRSSNLYYHKLISALTVITNITLLVCFLSFIGSMARLDFGTWCTDSFTTHSILSGEMSLRQGLTSLTPRSLPDDHFLGHGHPWLHSFIPIHLLPDISQSTLFPEALG